MQGSLSFRVPVRSNELIAGSAEESKRTAVEPLSSPPPLSRRKIFSGDRLFQAVTFSLAACILVVAVVILYELIRNSSLPLKTFGWRFLVDSTWDPVAQRFGALPFIYGTVVSCLVALCLAVPLSLGVSLWLTEIAPRWLAEPVTFLVELLAAIPSVVYGLWGILVLVPWVRSYVEPALGSLLGFLPLFQGPKIGVGMLAAGITLAIMVTPFITSMCREVFLAVPTSLKEAAFALGATRWEMIRSAVLPYGRSGIIGGIMLGLGRAVGETMAVTMVIGNRPEIALSLFAPASTMASVIANEFTEATYDLYLQALVEIGLVLFGITVLINLLARLLVWSMAGRTA